MNGTDIGDTDRRSDISVIVRPRLVFHYGVPHNKCVVEIRSICC